MAPLRRILGQHKPPEPGTHRMRDNEILRLTSCGWQLKSRHRSKRCPWWCLLLERSGASIGVSGGGHEGQACESSPTSCFAIWEEFWNKWPAQWSTLLRIFLARTAAEVTEFGKKAQGTVHATDDCERDQEWLGMQCGTWFPSRAACIGHQGVRGRDPTRRLAAGSQCPVCRTEFHMRERPRRSQWRKLSALTQPKRSREKGVRGQGLAGCGVRRVNVPNDVWILDALMTAMSSALPSAPTPARTVVQ